MKCVIYGAGYMGKHIDLDVLKIKYQLTAYCDSNEKLAGSTVNGYEIISKEELQRRASDGEVKSVIVAIYSWESRNEVINDLVDTLSKYNVSIEDYFVVRDKLVYEYLKKYHKYEDDNWQPEFSEDTYDWLRNIHEEIKYFLESMAKPASTGHEVYLHRLQNNNFFSTDNPSEFDINFENMLKDNDMILDIGCGLVTHYGTETATGKHINLVPVDALSYFYNLINEKYSAGINIIDKKCKFGLLEFMNCFFQKNSVDYIVINNALEHGIDPYKGLIKCLYILKPNGMIHMKHHRAEGIFEFWQGLHQWNVDYNEKNDFMLWNKSNSINISQKLKDIADITLIHDEATEDNVQPEIYIDIKKKRDFSINEFIEEDCNQLAIVVTKLMECYAEKIMSDM